ncbi:hypothetical protein E2C01_097047 [Portunus trituberculatus]|uniref:Uncharacterized protein n=1 Tax=Portunus trituberculatus TaxID=210409 RepID=A0A5B7KA39_PORTR|nr:hypothetical protein [Portunus trituberculatus]
MSTDPFQKSKPSAILAPQHDSTPDTPAPPAPYTRSSLKDLSTAWECCRVGYEFYMSLCY